MNIENELSTIVIENNLPDNKVKELSSKFAASFEQAQALIKEVDGLVVTDDSQTELIEKARRARLKLKNVRVDAEKTRKALKEQSLREGKAIDGVNNIIKAMIVPVEEHLEAQEKFAELQAAKRRADLLADRTAKLSQYVDDVSVYNLADMSEETFATLLSNAEIAFNEAVKAAQKAEADRIAREKAEAEEQERIRKENAKLKAEADAREEAMAKERAAAEEKRKAEVAEANKKAAAMRAATEKKLAAERKKREALEKKERERAQAEADELDRIEKEKAKAAEAERAKLIAPDKDKLFAYADQIDALNSPEVDDADAKKLLAETTDFLARISKNLRGKAGEL